MKVDTTHAHPAQLRSSETRAPSKPAVAQPSTPRTTFDLRNGVTKEFLQSALTTEIGKNVQDVLGKHGLSLDDTAGMDWSADATSDRIVAGTTSMLSTFARQNPDLEGEALLDKFETTIRGGIDKGYQQALSILEAVSTFSPEVKELGAKTISMTHDKLTEWFAARKESLKAAEASKSGETSDAVTQIPAPS